MDFFVECGAQQNMECVLGVSILAGIACCHSNCGSITSMPLLLAASPCSRNSGGDKVSLVNMGKLNWNFVLQQPITLLAKTMGLSFVVCSSVMPQQGPNALWVYCL